MQVVTSSLIENILKDCFWEYNFTHEEIIALANSQNQKEQEFLFSKVLANSKELFKSMKIFKHDDLKRMIENYQIPKFNQDFFVRRINMLEYYFLDEPLICALSSGRTCIKGIILPKILLKL